MITIQYLEPGPSTAGITPSLAGKKLQKAFDQLPINCVLLGWNLPSALEEISRRVTQNAGAKLFRWQPLLAGDGTLFPEIEWRSQNIHGNHLLGFRGLPEFTFVCPNNPKARKAILTHLSDLAKSGLYDGIFLDRMRYPSPAADPVNLLTCFCEHCNHAAREKGLDLARIGKVLLGLDEFKLLRILFGEPIQPLSAFLEFRNHTISKFIAEVVDTLRSTGLEVGLDCFSPSLTQLVGQDLATLTPMAHWTKIMLYGHAYGPASLPFELSNLVNWLIKRKSLGEFGAQTILSTITKVPFSDFLHPSSEPNRIPKALLAEYERGRKAAGNSKLLAGVELVEIKHICELNKNQIVADLRSIKNGGADGLSLSWDLWDMPLERLDLVRSIWFA